MHLPFILQFNGRSSLLQEKVEIWKLPCHLDRRIYGVNQVLNFQDPHDYIAKGNTSFLESSQALLHTSQRTNEEEAHLQCTKERFLRASQPKALRQAWRGLGGQGEAKKGWRGGQESREGGNNKRKGVKSGERWGFYKKEKICQHMGTGHYKIGPQKHRLAQRCKKQNHNLDFWPGQGG